MKLAIALILVAPLLACAPKKPIMADAMNVMAEPGNPRCFFVYDGSIGLQCTEANFK